MPVMVDLQIEFPQTVFVACTARMERCKMFPPILDSEVTSRVKMKINSAAVELQGTIGISTAEVFPFMIGFEGANYDSDR